MRVSEICVKRIRVNQGLGVLLFQEVKGLGVVGAHHIKTINFEFF